MVVAILGLTLQATGQYKPLTFKEYDLPNGLHVILHEDRSAPVIATETATKTNQSPLVMAPTPNPRHGRRSGLYVVRLV